MIGLWSHRVNEKSVTVGFSLRFPVSFVVACLGMTAMMSIHVLVSIRSRY